MVLTTKGHASAAASASGRYRLPRDWRLRWLAKPGVFALCLAPLAWLVWLGLAGDLGANPIEATIRYTGDWALRFLLLSLAISPLKSLTGWTVVIRFRRMIGLFAFFYAALHLLAYVGLDQFFAWGAIWADVVKRRYITFGMIAFFLLVPLAVTSTKGAIKRLGAVRWKRLHMLVYPAAILASVHFFMMVKADHREPAIYAAILTILLGYRIFARFSRKRLLVHKDRRRGEASSPA